jgi:L-seryl-tRNA(Ser) seleniumtransferase
MRMVTGLRPHALSADSICARDLPPTSMPSTLTPGFAAPRYSIARTAAPAIAATATSPPMTSTTRFMPTVKQRPRPCGAAYRAAVELRDLPSVDELTRAVDDPLAVDAAREVLAEARLEIRRGDDPGDLGARVRERLLEVRRPSFRRVLNATGVIVHTNLGRAPLSGSAAERVAEVARGYSNLELELLDGSRGSRQDHVAAILRRLTGAEDALVVNNNAASLLLALAALAEGSDVVVSRGELIEIGDGFRIPDVLTRSGASLVEVGTTNRTTVADYERAVSDRTALLLRVHQSNFRVVGFAAQPGLEELASLARQLDLPLVDDLGSGAFVDLGDEPTARESLAAGADLVCFSGDKLLGGPQAGIVVGRRDLVERLRRHPLHRAVRIDKLCLAALEGTLLAYLEPERALREVPVLRMIRENDASVRARAERLAAAVGSDVESTVARVGGGALPLAELPSFACAVEESLAAALRSAEPPVVGVVRDGRLLLDCRTLADEEIDEVAAVVLACR